MRLVECPSCQRHVRSSDDECPFCGHGPIMRPAPRLSFASVLVAAPLLLATASCDSGKGSAESDAPTTKGEPANNEGGEGGKAEGGEAIDPPPDENDRPPAEKYGAPPPPDDIKPVAEGGEEIDKPNPDDERIEAPRYGAPPPPPDAIDPVPDERPAARKYGAPPAPEESPLK